MRTLIVYETKYGSTEKCALRLKEKLSGEVTLVNIKNEPAPALLDYDKVIIGGPVYVGSLLKKIGRFCGLNEQLLKTKKLGLFILNMREGEAAAAELDSAYSESLRTAAAALGAFGGAFNLSVMNPLNRMIVKKVSKVTEDTSSLSEESISLFAEQMNRA